MSKKSRFVHDIKIIKPLGQPTHNTHPHIIKEGEVTPFITRSEYQARRLNLIEVVRQHAHLHSYVSNNHTIVVPAGQMIYRSDQIPYLFRQNTEFLYLTGCLEPDCCLVMTYINSHYYTVLFTRSIDPTAEIWDGPRTHPEDATLFFGVNQSLPISEFPNFLRSYLKAYPNINFWYEHQCPVHPEIHGKIHQIMMEMGNSIRRENIKPLIQSLRLYKSKTEIALIQKACDIASDAFIRTIQFSTPGVCESQLSAVFDYECRIRGADGMAYPPVIAGGNRANIIHYMSNNQLLLDGDLILMDGGCEFHGYSSDISRTWPVNGHFTMEQRQIYEIVYDVNMELIERCKQLPSLNGLLETMNHLLGEKLQTLGVLPQQQTGATLVKLYQLCPHHISHYLGMDVHDTPTIKGNIDLKPGMVITIEPGVYLNSSNNLIPPRYRGIGIRLEDDIYISESGPVVLSNKCPKQIKEIELLASENNNKNH